MSPEITRLFVQTDYMIHLEFDNGEARVFDAKPYLDKGIFTELRDPAYFAQVKIIPGGIGWPNEQDLSADTLYLRGVPLESAAISEPNA